MARSARGRWVWVTRSAARLAGRFTAFTYDRRGRGNSGDGAPHAVQREIDDLDGVIAKAGGSAYVFGLSSGAALALEAAARGSAIRKLVLYEAPFIVDESRPAVPEDIVAQMDILPADDRRGDAVKLFMWQVGSPRIAIALMRFLPCGPAQARRSHPPLRHDDCLRTSVAQAASGRDLDISNDPNPGPREGERARPRSTTAWANSRACFPTPGLA
jgi:pimeloyl-ACP methyl ester carboxylesterase